MIKVQSNYHFFVYSSHCLNLFSRKSSTQACYIKTVKTCRMCCLHLARVCPACHSTHCSASNNWCCEPYPTESEEYDQICTDESFSFAIWQDQIPWRIFGTALNFMMKDILQIWKYSRKNVMWHCSCSHGCSGEGLQHFLGATKHAFEACVFRKLNSGHFVFGICHFSKIFWNSDCCQWFKVKSTDIWRSRIHTLCVWSFHLQF